MCSNIAPCRPTATVCRTWQIDDQPGAFAAVGLAGQLIYVHPSSRTLIVKLSYHPPVQPETLAYLKAIAHTPSP